MHAVFLMEVRKKKNIIHFSSHLMLVYILTMYLLDVTNSIMCIRIKIQLT